jgi:hypothetical protein
MRKATPITILILLTLLVTSSVTYAQGWFDTNWPYRKTITIDADQVDLNLTNFPVLVDITDADLDSKAQADGDDIIFTGADGTSKLDHEIESYSAGNLVAWVEIPFLDANTDTTLYMYYGNDVAAPQEDVEGTWNGSNYVMVQHLEETSGTRIDSTGFHNDSDEEFVTDPTAQGMINGADGFNGSTDYVRVPDAGSLQFGEGSLTVEAWINPISTITDTGGVRIANNRGTGIGGSYIGWQFKIKNETGSWRFSDTGIDDGALPYEPYEGSNTYPYNALYQVVMVYDAANDELLFYVDGALDGTRSLSPHGSISNTLPTVIGASIYHEGTLHGDDKQFFNGIIDEVRLSNEVRSAEWIHTSYTNQNNPSAFYLIGEEVVSDADEDGVPYDLDNCPNYPNGPLRGTCTEVVGVNWIVSTGQFCTVDADCGDSGKFCEKTQADNYPPGGNGIGDACDCEADFDCDSPGLDVDASNVEQFLWDFGRSLFNNPCKNDRFCFGDFTCDSDVDADDIPKLLEDFGRSLWDNPCPTPPACVPADWCVYADP